jgi:hypothetical protein
MVEANKPEETKVVEEVHPIEEDILTPFEI